HLLRRYFQSLIIRPGSFFKILSAMSRLRFMDKGVLKFAGSQMDTIRKRRKVYYTWVIFRRMTFDLKKITSLLNAYDIPVDVYLGTYDKIITPVKMKAFLNTLNNNRLILI